MAEPLSAVGPRPPSPLPRPTRAAVRTRAAAVWQRAAGPGRLLPGVAAVGCAVAGAWLLWGLGVALLVAVPFLLLLDARTGRG